MSRALVFDHDEANEVALEDAVSAGAGKLAWLELDREDRGALERVTSALELGDQLRDDLGGDSVVAAIRDFSSHVHVAVAVPDGPTGGLVRLDCLVGPDWLVTVGPGEAEAVREFRARVTGNGALGALDAPSFLAALLEWTIEGYLAAFDAIDVELEEVDVGAMRASDDRAEPILERLVALRRRTGRLRRALGDHRHVVAALAHPEFDPISTKESASRFERLGERLDHAIEVADGLRGSVLGSFELMVARSSQRTNDIMKVLTLASVMLLPATTLAAVLGMNFKVGLFQQAWLFWVAVGAMLAFGAVTLTVAHLRSWI